MLKNKVAIVTGSTSGIGLGIATSLAEQGANLVLNGFGKPEDIEAAKAQIAKAGGKVEYSSADMSKPQEIREMIAFTAKTLGSVDILVNNAGIQHVQPIDEFDDEKWDLIQAINLSAVFHATKAASQVMKANKWGRIVNIASVHGLVASKYKAAYVAAKHGVLGLTKVTALDLAEFGITANAICPGYVNTPLVQKQIPEQMAAHKKSREEVIHDVLLKNHAIKEFVEVSDLGALTVFLCSNAARAITGTALPVDAGWSAQ